MIIGKEQVFIGRGLPAFPRMGSSKVFNDWAAKSSGCKSADK
jgi:hypothetical protein